MAIYALANDIDNRATADAEIRLRLQSQIDVSKEIADGFPKFSEDGWEYRRGHHDPVELMLRMSEQHWPGGWAQS